MHVFGFQFLLGGFLASTSLAILGLSKLKRHAQLIAAAAQGDALAVQRLLDAGADPNVAQMDGHAPLWWAVTSGSIATVDLLLARGADPNAQGQGNSVIEQAISGMLNFQGSNQGMIYARILEKLVAHGADITGFEIPVLEVLDAQI